MQTRSGTIIEYPNRAGKHVVALSMLLFIHKKLQNITKSSTPFEPKWQRNSRRILKSLKQMAENMSSWSEIIGGGYEDRVKDALITIKRLEANIEITTLPRSYYSDDDDDEDYEVESKDDEDDEDEILWTQHKNRHIKIPESKMEDDPAYTTPPQSPSRKVKTPQAPLRLRRGGRIGTDRDW